MNTKPKGDILAERIEKLLAEYTLPKELHHALDEYRKQWTLGRTVNGFTLGPGQQWHRRPLPAVMVPLGPEDVKCGDIIREIWESYPCYAITSVHQYGVRTDKVHESWTELQSKRKISRDGGKTWERCEKEAK